MRTIKILVITPEVFLSLMFGEFFNKNVTKHANPKNTGINRNGTIIYFKIIKSFLDKLATLGYNINVR